MIGGVYLMGAGLLLAGFFPSAKTMPASLFLVGIGGNGFVLRDYNAFDANGIDCETGPPGAHSILSPVEYADADAFDLRLLPTSPCANSAPSTPLNTSPIPPVAMPGLP